MLTEAEKIFLSIIYMQIKTKQKVSRADKQAVIDICARVGCPVPAQLKQKMENSGFNATGVVVE